MKGRLIEEVVGFKATASLEIEGKVKGFAEVEEEEGKPAITEAVDVMFETSLA